MNISKTVLLPKVGKSRMTFYRDRRKASKDKKVFSLPFDIDLSEKIASGEIIYSPLTRACRVMWNESPDDATIAEEAEKFIKEFLFGTLMSVTEPIEPEEAMKIMAELNEFISSALKGTISENGSFVLTMPIVSKESKNLKVIIRKKDTGDYFLSDDGVILRSFRPHERGQKDRVIFMTKKFGIEIREEEIYLESTPDELPSNLYKFIQIISAIYLFYLS